MSSDDERILTRSDVTLLYHGGFWDYPRSGVLTWRGERLWFQEAEFDSGQMRLYRLTPDEWAHEDALHAAFREHVGTHTDYDLDTQSRSHGGVKPGGPDAWRPFYDDPRWKQQRDYTDHPVVAVLDYFADDFSVGGTQ